MSNSWHLSGCRKSSICRTSRASRIMIGDVLRGLREQIGFSAQDAGLIIPGGIVQLRQLNLPYMTQAELSKEAEAPGFWIELEPDIGKLEDPFVAYDTLVSSENDDLTHVVIGYAETAAMRQWSDMLLNATSTRCIWSLSRWRLRISSTRHFRQRTAHKHRPFFTFPATAWS